jgi:hypothetical protein
MASDSIHLEKTSGQAPVLPPKVIQAQSHARISTIRIWAGSSILGLLTLGYLVSLLYVGKDVPALLPLIASGIGFLLGGRDRDKSA